VATLLALAAEPEVAASAWPWLAPLIAFVVALLGGGGVSALIKARADRAQGVAQQETAEDDALSNRWKMIIETQTKVLLEPMQTQLTELKAEVEKWKGEVKKVQDELETSRRKYWNAIAYIRTLLIWISRHMPADIEQTAVPEPTANIAEDI
jgi:uncharacterized protein HemX